MGTDIHAYIEKKDLETGNWYPLHYDDKVKELLYNVHVSRNYELFAMLADVRNGEGFAGCKIFEPFEKSELWDRGKPADISDFFNSGDEFGYEYHHGHTFGTVKEYLNINWNVDKVFYGYVDRNQYRAFKEHGSPEHWCGDVGGGAVKKAPSTRDFEKDQSYTHVQVAWLDQPFNDDTSFLCLIRHLYEMSELKHEEKGEDIRILICFDS